MGFVDKQMIQNFWGVSVKHISVIRQVSSLKIVGGGWQIQKNTVGPKVTH